MRWDLDGGCSVEKSSTTHLDFVIFTKLMKEECFWVFPPLDVFPQLRRTESYFQLLWSDCWYVCVPPAECVLHQLPAAPPGSAESDDRRRRQQVSGGREQQTQAAGVQLRRHQTHEAHLDVLSGKPLSERRGCECTTAHKKDVARSSCAMLQPLSVAAALILLFVHWYSVCSRNFLLVLVCRTDSPWIENAFSWFKWVGSVHLPPHFVSCRTRIILLLFFFFFLFFYAVGVWKAHLLQLDNELSHIHSFWLITTFCLIFNLHTFNVVSKCDG